MKHECRVAKNQALCDAFDELATCYFEVKVKNTEKEMLGPGPHIVF